MLEHGSCCKNGINPKAVYDFITRCEKEDLGVNSMMLIKNGKIVAQGCHSPFSNTTKHIMYSLSKSITATALGFAVDEGKVSLDDSISMFFPEYDKKRKKRRYHRPPPCHDDLRQADRHGESETRQGLDPDFL